jgi:hypothetical protein
MAIAAHAMDLSDFKIDLAVHGETYGDLQYECKAIRMA